MTPHEAWAKEKPQVWHLRVFGCDAYAHIPKDEKQKLDQKMRKYIFWDMANRQRDTDSITKIVVKYFTAVM